MKRPSPFLLALFLLTAAVNAQTTPRFGGGANNSTQLQARERETKSFAAKLEVLQNAPDSEETRYQIALALFKTEKWDEALAKTRESLKTAIWSARFHYLLGQIYVKAPHQAWKIGDKLTRAEQYPQVEDGTVPTRVDLSASDAKAALENLEIAKIEAARERPDAAQNRGAAPVGALRWDEENDLNFDLAALLSQGAWQQWLAELEKNGDAPFDETIDPAQIYVSGWSLPKKVLFLYAQIRVLDQGPDRHDSAVSLFAEAPVEPRLYQLDAQLVAPATIRRPKFRRKNRIPFPS